MFIKRLFLPILSFFIFSMISFNCGGGGSSSEHLEEPIVIPQSVSVINGLIHIGEDLDNYPDGLVSIIEVISVDKNGKEIDRKNISTTNGYFSINSVLSNDGGNLVVTVNTEGYTPGTKTITYNSPADFNNLMLSIRIDPVAKQVVSITEINVTSNREKIVKVNFYKNKEGKIYTAENSEDPLMLSLSIPIKKLQTDTESVLVEYKGYKPSNPKDYQNFPGTYTDNDEELISVGFFTLDIKDPKTGKNPFIQNISSQLVRNKGEYYRLLSFIDCEQLLKIKEILGSLDEDPDKEGIQITFYAFDFDKGKWIKAGVGTFVSNSNVNYDEFGDNPDSIDTVWDYIIFNGCVDDLSCSAINSNSLACVDVNGDQIADDVSCEGNGIITDENLICTNIKPVYVVVSVLNPELQWKNLDYIKPAREEMKLSLTVVVKDDEGNPLAIPVNLVPINSCIDYSTGYTSEKDGKVILETFKYCDNDIAYIEYINPFTGLYESYPSNDFISVSNTNLINITISNPLKCEVIGKIEDTDGNPKRDIYVYVNDNSLGFYNSAFSDEDGIYSLNVPCNIPLNIYISSDYNNFLTANVNGILEEDEDNDNGKSVYLKPYKIQNNPPDGYGYLSTYSTKWGSIVDVYIYAWDYEGDIPIGYKLKFLNQDNDVIKEYIGQIPFNYGFTSVSINTGELPEINATYKVVLDLVDSKFTGDIGSLSQDYKEINIGFISISLPDENTPPKIIYFYASPSTVSRVGSMIKLYGNGYDIDGDALISKVRFECFDNDNNIIDNDFTPNGESVLNKGYEEFYIPNNQNIKKCKFIWELSDGNDTVYSEPAFVEIKNTPPYVYIWPEKEIASIEESVVSVYAIVKDRDGDALSCNWYINGFLDNDQHSCDNYILYLENFEPDSGIHVKLEVSDGSDTSSAETIIHYGQPSDLNIIIQ